MSDDGDKEKEEEDDKQQDDGELPSTGTFREAERKSIKKNDQATKEAVIDVAYDRSAEKTEETRTITHDEQSKEPISKRTRKRRK